jgi:ribosomal protein S18 acetylase RimI-like enzyme
VVHQRRDKLVSGTRNTKGPGEAAEISLRPARSDDYDFAVDLYLDSTKRLLTDLGRWNRGRVVARFRRGFKAEQAQVICLKGADIGWLQISEPDDRLHLHQLHIAARFRNRGIGTRLIRALLDRARRAGRPVGLNVIRGNRALSLYRQLGFRVVGGDAERLYMRWNGKSPERP